MCYTFWCKEVQMCRATIYEARNNFSAFVKRAELGEPVELTRHEKPVAVIISYEEYEKKAYKKSFFSWLEEFKKENADILEGFEGLPVPEDTPLDDAYTESIIKMWSEE